MDRGRLRVIVLGVATIAALVAGLLALPWFRATYGGVRVTIDLLHVEACAERTCSATSVGDMAGLYPTLAHLTFGLGFATAAVVLVQILLRTGSGAGSATVTKIGAWVAVALLLATGATGFVFQPEHHAGAVEYDIVRALGPIALIVGVAGALATLLYATQHDLEGGAYTPIKVTRKFKDPVRTNADTREISQEQIDAAKNLPLPKVGKLIPGPAPARPATDTSHATDTSDAPDASTSTTDTSSSTTKPT